MCLTCACVNSNSGKAANANARTHRAAAPEQYALDVAALAARLAMLPPKGEERARLLKENGKTAVGRSVNHSAGRSDGGASK